MLQPTVTVTPSAEKFIRRMVRFSEHPEGGFRLSEQVDRAQTRGLRACFSAHTAAQLALVLLRQFAIQPETNLTGDDQQIARAFERHIIRDGGNRRGQGDAEITQAGFDG